MREQEAFLQLLLQCLESGRVDDALGRIWERYRRQQACVKGENG